MSDLLVDRRGTPHAKELAAQALREYVAQRRPAVPVDVARARARRARRHGLRRSLSWQARTPRGWRPRARLVVRYVANEREVARRQALEDVCAARGHVTHRPDPSCPSDCVTCVRCGRTEHYDPRLGRRYVTSTPADPSRRSFAEDAQHRPRHNHELGYVALDYEWTVAP